MGPLKTSHTPGPWELVVGEDAKVKCPDGRTFDFGDAIYHKENIANARLASCSPDLLKELFFLVNEVEMLGLDYSLTHVPIAKALIKKASL